MNEPPARDRKIEQHDHLLRFWAKTSHDPEAAPNAFHPLICHMIDVACVAEAIWDRTLPEVARLRLARAFGLENDIAAAGKLIAFLAGLHDLGKCSPPFALRGCHADGRSLLRKRDDANRDEASKRRIRQKIQTIELLDLYSTPDFGCQCDGVKASSEAPHGFVTGAVLPPMLTERLRFPSAMADHISALVGGHHGTFADSNCENRLRDRARNPRAEYCGDDKWRAAQRALFDALAQLFGIEGDFSGLPNKKFGDADNATAMIFAGLVSVADWIGSNVRHDREDLFVSHVPDHSKVLDGSFSFDLDAYRAKSERTASRALEILGWSRWPKGGKAEPRSFDRLFPKIAANGLRGLQEAAVDIADSLTENDLGVCVVEAPMGEGKTEAAMYLAEAFNSKLGTRGIYFALPTQATSNQMFGRVEEFLRERYKGEKVDGEPVNVHLMLQHGHASISEEFEEKIKAFDHLRNVYDDAERSTDAREASNVVAAEWFTYKKRGLLVPFGVGTIDQILLAVLQTKHVFVRLFGLANKTVIIDEVHAYDAYMSTLLERLLEWLAALGSPVIILSATLPKQKRDSLMRAYLKGLGKAADGDVLGKTGDQDEYPRISYATATMPERTFTVRGIGTSDLNTKILYLEWKDEDAFVEQLKVRLKDGGCVAIICNAVDKAQSVYSKLADDPFFQRDAYFDPPAEEHYGKSCLDLLHARFRYKDRKQREQRSLLRFGKPDGIVTVTDENGESIDLPVRRPNLAVLVSTQIVEQSLDLDFDLMISELAPADLLLQRAGRLQRHLRNRPTEFLDTATSKGKPALQLLRPQLDENGQLLIDDKGLPNFGLSGLIYDKHILLRSWLKLRKSEQIKIPCEIQDLVEFVYKKNQKCIVSAYEPSWNATQALLNKKLSDKTIKAKFVRLPEFDESDFFDSFNFQLDEDDPEQHQSLRAQTRDEERPSVSLVVLTKDEIAGIDLDTIPDKELSKFLIFREVRLSRPEVTNAILKDPERFQRKTWRKNRLLRHHRLVVLEQDDSIGFGKLTLKMDPTLGIVYEPAKES